MLHGRLRIEKRYVQKVPILIFSLYSHTSIVMLRLEDVKKFWRRRQVLSSNSVYSSHFQPIHVSPLRSSMGQNARYEINEILKLIFMYEI